MNHKTATIITCLFMAGILSGCGSEIQNPCQFSSETANEVLSSEAGMSRADGFAESLCVPETIQDFNTENVDALAFAHFDDTDTEIRSQKNLYEKVYPASTTKILTCLLALELCDPEETVTVPDEAEITVAGSSMADLRPGDQLRMKDLLYALMVPSGNDAAVAVAMHISGSLEEFSALMNKRAVQLGATRSHFTNPHGLPDEEHYTCVYDMYLIFREASRHEMFRTVSSAGEYSAKILNTSDNSERDVTWTSGNGFYSGKFRLAEGLSYYGGKTGHTNAAGYCLVLGTENSEKEEAVSIIMKAPGYDELYQGMAVLTSK